MVYIDNWSDFQKAVEELYMGSPLKTRYLVKYRHADAKVVLKATDGPTTIKYKTEYVQDIKKMEKLHRSLLCKIINAKELPKENEKSKDVKSEPSASTANASSSTANTSTTKSKKKKGKKNHK